MQQRIVRAVTPFLAAGNLAAVVEFHSTHPGFKVVTLDPPESPTLTILDSIVGPGGCGVVLSEETVEPAGCRE
ncbi:MAG: hypothetical protein IT438_04000 [Phycisphaerales bacterium]|nr:hypothetical protein [Phycisphaerales bacterium]